MPPAGPPVSVLPGQNKDAAAFQQDELVCQQHAVAHTGYGDLTRSGAPGAAVSGANSGVAGTAAAGSGAGITNAAAVTPSPDAVGYLQCMAARGDTVQAEPAAYADGYGYGYSPDLYPYGYGYGYPYDYYDGGFAWGGGGYGGWHGGGFHHGGFGRGGFAQGGFGHGGFGGGHGGFGGGHGGGGGHR
jgi:hypothetical protein